MSALYLFKCWCQVRISRVVVLSYPTLGFRQKEEKDGMTPLRHVWEKFSLPTKLIDDSTVYVAFEICFASVRYPGCLGFSLLDSLNSQPKTLPSFPFLKFHFPGTQSQEPKHGFLSTHSKFLILKSEMPSPVNVHLSRNRGEQLSMSCHDNVSEAPIPIHSLALNEHEKGAFSVEYFSGVVPFASVLPARRRAYKISNFTFIILL